MQQTLFDAEPEPAAPVISTVHADGWTRKRELTVEELYTPAELKRIAEINRRLEAKHDREQKQRRKRR